MSETLPFRIGTRVKFRSRAGGKILLGTVAKRIEGPSRTIQDIYIVYADLPESISKSGNTPEESIELSFIPPGHEYWFTRSRIEPLEGGSEKRWEFLPADIGVYFPKTEIVDGVKFPAGTVGRIREGDPNTTLLVKWFMPDGNNRVWNVNGTKVEFCRIDPNNRKFVCPWPSNTPAKAELPPFPRGTIVVYDSYRPCRRSTSLSIVTGVILRVEKEEGTRIVQATIVGGVPEEHLGEIVRLEVTTLKELPYPWLPRNVSVEVTEDIRFRKISLRGKTGRVLWPTDNEGDVGVEFQEDLEAGSLDGTGRDGRCLYVPATALSETSE